EIRQYAKNHERGDAPGGRDEAGEHRKDADRGLKRGAPPYVIGQRAPEQRAIKPAVASRPDSAGPSPNSLAIAGRAAPNKAKRAASNMMPRNARKKKFRCQRENGNFSSRVTSSANSASSTAIVPSPINRSACPGRLPTNTASRLSGKSHATGFPQ